jgi:hypothetical protein
MSKVASLRKIIHKTNNNNLHSNFIVDLLVEAPNQKEQ